MSSVLTALLAVVGAAVVAIVFVEIVHWLIKRTGRRSPAAADLARTMHRPFRATTVLVAVQQAVRIWAGDFPGRSGVVHVLVLLCIAAAAWMVGAALLVLEDIALAKWRTDVPDNLKSRRIKTQVVMLRRVTVAAIVVVTVGVMLMTFPDIRALGASVLASAGVISVVAALAAQSTLGNMFAGIQLAFSDAIRVDDVVVVEQEWGRIEEITLTHVVVQIWDDRRLILPTSYFTTKPFQNWTRTSSAVLGTADIDVDWATPVDPLRAELQRVCEGSELWNGRVCVLQVTEATDSRIRLRALVSADDAAALWDLRCLVREQMVAWIWQHQRGAVPRLRAELEQAGPEPVKSAVPVPAQPDGHHGPESGTARVFSGGVDGDARGVVFGGPDPAAADGAGVAPPRQD